MTRLLKVLPLVASAVVVFGAPALAQTDAPSVVVRYTDLNLDSPAAAGVLEQRIERAATAVCGGQPDLRELDRRRAFDDCRFVAIHRAVSQLRVAGVTLPAHGAGISPLASR